MHGLYLPQIAAGTWRNYNDTTIAMEDNEREFLSWQQKSHLFVSPGFRALDLQNMISGLLFGRIHVSTTHQLISKEVPGKDGFCNNDSSQFFKISISFERCGHSDWSWWIGWDITNPHLLWICLSLTQQIVLFIGDIFVWHRTAQIWMWLIARSQATMQQKEVPLRQRWDQKMSCQTPIVNSFPAKFDVVCTAIFGVSALVCVTVTTCVWRHVLWKWIWPHGHNQIWISTIRNNLGPRIARKIATHHDALVPKDPRGFGNFITITLTHQAMLNATRDLLRCLMTWWTLEVRQVSLTHMTRDNV